MIATKGYAANQAGATLAPFSFERRDPGPNDVAIDILYCGVCHTDIHQARDEWGGSMFPMVPGHEIVGRVSAVGSNVTRFAAGDHVGVGCLVDSCRTCPSCRDGEEQYCAGPAVFTYNAPDPKMPGKPTYGGYSDHIVVDQDFTLKISPKLDLAATAPLLCAGITTYSPLRHWNVQPGQKVGIVGLGGLGHMGLKFARAMGAHVVQFTTSPNKRDDALKLGAHEVVLSRDEESMRPHTGTFDLILDTVSANHDVNALLGMLRRDGRLVVLGLPPDPPPIPLGTLIWARRSLSGSLIGGLRQTQEMLDYCAEHGITSDIELIPIQKINEAFERTVRADVKYRFVIDMASLRD